MQIYKNKHSKLKIIMLISLMALIFTVGFCSAFLADADTSLATFTVGDINILLTESKSLDLTIVPDKTIAKDPVVTVIANSVPSYLFVEITEINNPGTFLEYIIEETWNPLDGYENIYYTITEQKNIDQDFSILKDNAVIAKRNIRKETLKNLSKSSYPSLTFSAYAIQRDGITSEKEAWEILLVSKK